MIEMDWHVLFNLDQQLLTCEQFNSITAILYATANDFSAILMHISVQLTLGPMNIYLFILENVQTLLQLRFCAFCSFSLLSLFLSLVLFIFNFQREEKNHKIVILKVSQSLAQLNVPNGFTGFSFSIN